jgi:hypothetical protein
MLFETRIVFAPCSEGCIFHIERKLIVEVESNVNII